jgi:hypothetical protein
MIETPSEASTAVHQIGSAALFAGIGSLIAVGQILLSKEKITCRLVIGRCISTGGLAMCAGAALAIFPTLPLVAQMGIAAMLASLGTSALEMIAQRVLGGRS